jgi:hypothetical protein
MRRSGELEYACARIAARLGERPNEAAWRAIAVVRGFAAFLDVARTPPFRRWIGGIAADATPHAVEAALLGHWRALVEELRGWMPEQWHSAIAWAGALVDLPIAQYLARGGASLPWMADDPVLHALSRNAGQPPVGGALAPLARAWANPEGLFRAWVDEWSRRVPRRPEAARSPLMECARLLVAHRAALAASSVADGALMRRALVARLSALYRRATLDPAAAFVFLALSALDMERLRGELLRRAVFPRLGRLG